MISGRLKLLKFEFTVLKVIYLHRKTKLLLALKVYFY